MEGKQVHRVEEVLFSFTYNRLEQASLCNARLHRLMGPSLVPELENSFDLVSHGGLSLEIDRLEIDLGILSEEDISEDLGSKIQKLLVQALKNEIRERIFKGMGNMEIQSPQSLDFSKIALMTFFLRGYFPAWLDSSLDLSVLLTFLISNSPKSLRDMVLEISVKSESARKRIAYLDAPYFDQIIGILIPGDAEWIFSYRNTYLEIHQSESDLPGSSENLEKALNLFILTFITGNSGTKFNRLSFSDRFLKSIAAYYNLDFRVFLQEITEILRQNTIENQLFRDFRETLTWVGEKNQLGVQTSDESYQPTFFEFTSWLDQSKENKSLEAWVDKLSLSGVLFSGLSVQFPEFWKSLSKTGLTKLIQLLGKGKADKWLELTYSYLAWSSRMAKTESSDQLKVVKEIVELAQQESTLRNIPLIGLEGWFSVLVLHAYSKFGTKSEISQGLVSLGQEAGISNPSLFLIRIKVIPNINGKEKGDKAEDFGLNKSDAQRTGQQESQAFSKPVKFQELALFDYLNSGTLRGSFQSLGKNDLQWVVAGMVKSLNPNLLNLIRNSVPQNFSLLKSRFLGLLERLSRSEVLDYVSRFSGPQTLHLLRFNEKLLAYLNPVPELIQRLDQQVLNLFLEEVRNEPPGKGQSQTRSILVAGDSFLSLLHRIKSSESSDQMLLHALQRKFNSDRSLLVFIAHNHGLSPKMLSRLEGVLNGAGQWYPGYGLLDLKSPDSKNLQKQFFDSLSWKVQSSFRPSHLHLFDQEGVGSWPDLLLAGKISRMELAWEADMILERDFKLLVKTSISKITDRNSRLEVKGSVHRIFGLLQSDPEVLLRFFQKPKNRLPLILNRFHQHLNKGDWKKLTQWLSFRFPEELAIFNRILERGLNGFLNNQAWLKSISGEGAVSSTSLDQILNPFGGMDLESTRSLGELPRIFSSGLAREVEFLLHLPDSVFFRKSIAVQWRKSVLISAFQFRIRAEHGTGLSASSFWEIFRSYLKGKKSAFGPETLDWNYLFHADQLDKDTQTMLLQFFKTQYLKGPKKGLGSTTKEKIASAIGHLNEEGFLPWWSPVRSKAGLIFSLLTLIEHSEKEEGLVLIPLISKGKTSRLLAGLNQDQLIQLLNRLSSSAYKKHFSSLIRAIGIKLKGNGSKQGKTDLISDRQNSKSLKSTGDLKVKSAGAVERWIKMQVNGSKEAEVLKAWFENDSKIQDQLQDLMAWSRFMFFGNLNPGKWKQWLLSFGFEFYIRKGNSYSAGFLGHFLGHLSRSQGMVNWKGVFHQLLKNREFLTGHNLVFKEQILAQFPTDPVRDTMEPATGDQVRIANAGLILCWPFLSVLFSRLKLSSGGIIPLESQDRAVFLLQYLAFGHCDFPEYELVLNKILVGMKSSQHLEKVELTSEEKNMAESLLQGMKNNWEKMKNASVEAIRETFLQREGVLEFGSASIILRVPKTGVDVLLDSISWNISVVRLPWMEKSLEVKWR